VSEELRSTRSVVESEDGERLPGRDHRQGSGLEAGGFSDYAIINTSSLRGDSLNRILNVIHAWGERAARDLDRAVTAGAHRWFGGVSLCQIALLPSPDWRSTVETRRHSGHEPDIHPADPGTKILVAEDDPDTQRLLTEMLGHFGYTVFSASDGETALDMLRSEAIPIALLDWAMPKMEGVEVCRRARADAELEARYLILITGRSGTDEVVRGLEAGADDYVVKPVDARELRSRLRVAERVMGLQQRLTERVRELQLALEEVNRLEGLIPICAYCKNVRNEKDFWERVERYVESRSTARFSHGICPSCLARVKAEEKL
jgi:phosphoserine phosphatase RsbU/P